MGFGNYLVELWNITSFSFVNPFLLNNHNSRIISLDGLPELFKSDKLDYWVEKFSSAIQDEEKKSLSRNRRFRIYRPLFWTIWKPLLNALILRLLFDILALLSSIFLSFFSTSSSTDETITSSIYIFVTVIIKSFFDCYSRFVISRLCIKVEGSLVWIALDRVVRHKEMYPELPLSTVFMVDTSKKPSSCRKSLLLRQHEVKFSNSNAASKSSNIFNLIIGDASAIELFFGVFVDFLLLPIRLLMSWLVLSKVLNSSSALPTIVTFCIILISSFLFEIIGAFYKEPYMIERDHRIDRCHEIISDMRSIRLTGLEEVAISRITKSRERELYWNKKRFFCSRIAAFADYHLKVYPQYILFVLSMYYTFYNQSSNVLSNKNFIYSGASALQILMQLSSKLRTLPTNIIEGIISIQRFEDFIIKHPIEKREPFNDFNNTSDKPCSETIKSYRVDYESNNNGQDGSNRDFSISFSSQASRNINVSESTSLLGIDYSNQGYRSSHNSKSGPHERDKYPDDVLISIKEGAFSWNQFHNDSFTNSTLKNIDLTLRTKECIFLVGEPGCGKSSLIKAILNEIRPLTSEIFVRPRETNSTISYSSQLPWIPRGSVRYAILLGREWNREKYELIVDSCQLKEDFSSWQRGDLRTVDEGGFSLSGGQRARVSLARALYSLPIRYSSHSKNRFFIDAENPRTYESLLYLFDDVFVSVDPKVGFQIFNRLFGPNGLLLSVASVVSISIDSLHHYMSNIKLLYEKYNNDKLGFEEESCTKNTSGNTRQSLINKNLSSEPCECLSDLSPIGNNRNSIHTGNKPSLNRCTPLPTPSPFSQDSSSDYGGFKFNVCVLNDGKIEWSGSYAEYLKYTGHVTEYEMPGDDEPEPNSPYFKDLQILSLNLNDDSNNTDTEFAELLNSCEGSNSNESGILNNSSSKHLSFSSYMWYFKLLGKKWAFIFLLGSLSKVAIDKLLELLFVNRSKGFQSSEYQINRFFISATIAVGIETIISLMIYIGEAIGGIEAARKSHEILLDKIIYAPFWFFDMNSVGKILSRFSSDMLAIDNCTIRRITCVILPLITLLCNFTYVSFIVPLALPLEILIILFITKYIGRRLILTYRDAQRSALLAQSPLCSIFSECLSGGTIIRAFGAEKPYFERCGRYVDKLQRARFLQHSSCQWAGIRMQLLSAPLTLVVSMIGVFFPSYKSALALPLTYTINFAESINEIIFRLISLEKDMCSVGRIYDYIQQIEEDGSIHTQVVTEDLAIPDTRQGILISNLEVRYRRPDYKLVQHKTENSLKPLKNKTENRSSCKGTIEGSMASLMDEMYFSPTLKDINEFAGPNDHIGIVGRTGSGKSTFIMALFGFVPTTKGHVYLDGVPINHLSPSTKRKVVGVLPQVPLILKGWTVRDFLDPEGQRSSEDLWEALRICCLSSTIRSLPGGKMLDTILVPDVEISSTGDNQIYSRRSNRNNAHESSQDEITNLVAKYLSDSQLRYLSLTRLVVNARDYRLILVDEPPPDTFEDQGNGKSYVPVHELLRTYFPHCTVFVVAHHAASLQNCNSIWVLGNGTVETVIHPKGIVGQKYLAGLLRNN
ncbi:ABC transporter family protein [Cryptosporidium felis]|nr:ABC transporter family protein [Cryptosporidium felis]